jgi:hypothetical protein
MKENIISGFRTSGIVPCDRQKILQKLPKNEPNEDEVTVNMLQPVIDLLQEHRFPERQAQTRGRKRKINTPAGRAVSVADFTEQETQNSENDEDDSDEPENTRSTSDSNDEDSVESDERSEASEDEIEEIPEEVVEEDEDPGEDENTGPFAVEVGQYFVVHFTTTEDRRTRLAIGVVKSFNETSVTLLFLRRRYASFFAFPRIDDLATVPHASLVRQLTVHTNKRGLHTFLEETTGLM